MVDSSQEGGPVFRAVVHKENDVLNYNARYSEESDTATSHSTPRQLDIRAPFMTPHFTSEGLRETRECEPERK